MRARTVRQFGPGMMEQTADHAPIGHHAAFRWPVRVYYEDTDVGGVVYYANYLKFMERARTEWLRAKGFELPTLEDEHGILFVVRAVDIEYLKPARFNDALVVTLELCEHGRSQITVSQRVLRGHEVLTRARVRAVCVDTQTMRPTRIPPVVLHRLLSIQSESD
ncbi:MAG: tol-pal system-associated acyl-CoA thioesterase [Burkholderiales bacterium]|nr:tol-pal system-associated acyl-CoA thioesterase [Burkholderiales bacterium]